MHDHSSSLLCNRELHANKSRYPFVYTLAWANNQNHQQSHQMINCRPYSPIAWLNDFHTQAALSPLQYSSQSIPFLAFPSTDFSHKTHHKLLLFQLLTLQPRVTLKSHNPLTKFSHNSSLPFSLLALCRKHNNTNQEIKFNHFPFSSQEAEA